jgi:tRNA (adenine57-N1/adenine58-N1)-methyltransferase
MKKALITRENKTYFFNGEDMHTQYGVIRKKDIEKSKPGTLLETNTGKKMTVIEPDFSDRYRKIKRRAQVIPKKDIGQIIAECGLNSKSKVLEAGAGSGGLCLALANVVKKVYSYEIREDFSSIVKQNIKTMGFSNVVLKDHDIYTGIPDKNFDCIVLDLPEPWKAAEHALAALKIGGRLVSYSPSIIQARDMITELRRIKGFVYIKTCEIIERIWEAEGRKVRPKEQPIIHSGFLTFARKV